MASKLFYGDNLGVLRGEQGQAQLQRHLAFDGVREEENNPQVQKVGLKGEGPNG